MEIETCQYISELEGKNLILSVNMVLIKEMSVWEFFLVKSGIHKWKNYLFTQNGD